MLLFFQNSTFWSFHWLNVGVFLFCWRPYVLLCSGDAQKVSEANVSQATLPDH
jgi:hypothetical protein